MMYGWGCCSKSTKRENVRNLPTLFKEFKSFDVKVLRICLEYLAESGSRTGYPAQIHEKTSQNQQNSRWRPVVLSPGLAQLFLFSPDYHVNSTKLVSSTSK